MTVGTYGESSGYHTFIETQGIQESSEVDEEAEVTTTQKPKKTTTKSPMKTSTQVPTKIRVVISDEEREQLQKEARFSLMS